MYLLLGDLQDPLCERTRTALEVKGYQARIVTNPMAQPLRFAWRLDDLSSASQLIWADGTRLFDSEIAGVLVRSPGWIASDGWKPEDLAYVQMETRAALLAWLWSLHCPVVNRYPAALWYYLDAPTLFWRPWLEQCELRAPHELISNVEQETRAFGASLSDDAVYAPLTAEGYYLLNTGDRWDKLAAMLRHAPVHLTQASIAQHTACVVGPRVVWEGGPPFDADTLEPALARLAAVAGLAFLEIVITLTNDCVDVAAVYPYPRFERFGLAAQREIVSGLARLLTGDFGFS
jgi:hypothetical protein